MKNYLVLWLVFIFLIPFNSKAQENNIFKGLYEDFLKYGTVYGAGDIRNSVEVREPIYFVRTNPNGSIYDVPDVVDVTPDFPFDYRIGFGIRKLARFGYERKPRNYYDGTEDQLAFTAPTSAFQGLEYQIHHEKERWRGEYFKNYRYFVKHTGKYHIIKAESREVGRINLNYQSAEVRARLPIGSKFSISGGAIYRTHDRAYGYNPIEIWLNETNEAGYAVNPWYTLGFMYGYDDIYYSAEDELGNEVDDWYWIDPEGNQVAATDLEFRETVFRELMQRYNREQWDLLDRFGEIAPIVGFDFYHYKNNFWIHAYANYILPYHKYLRGDENVSYLNRNNWGKGGLRQDSELEQWDDYSFGANFGWKINRHLGLFIEGEYAKMWDSELFNTSFGLNYTIR
tara:strand:- start:1819 stop:3012 length:1194 start_codon:yes stop_codon:yes gene_type:complete